jgi:type VI secretion system protein ImpH
LRPTRRFDDHEPRNGPPGGDKPSGELQGLARRLFEKPFDFDFFQAVRLLHLIDPSRAAVGRGGPPGAEAVRFRTLNSLSFPPSAIHDLGRPGPDEPVPVLTQTFLGLTGPSGVLPRHYTELVMRLERDSRLPERNALRDWLDLFNHRMVSLFYRAWEKYRFYGAYGRGEADRPGSSPFAQALLSLAGLGLAPLRDRLGVAVRGPAGGEARVLARVDDLAVVHFAGLFAHRPRSAAGLQALVSDYLQSPVRVYQFQGQWLRLEPANQTRLGGAPGGQGLGASTVVGERVWDVQSKIRLGLGPLSYAKFLELLPDRAPVPARKAFFLLCHLVRLYVGPGLDFDVQLVLPAGEVPEYRLGDESGVGARLGWNVWVHSLPLEREAGDAVFDAQEVSRLDPDLDGCEPEPPGLGVVGHAGWFGLGADAGGFSW